MMHYRYHIGQTVPLDYPRPAFTGRAAPAWWIMLCGRRREQMIGAGAKLLKLGAEEAWFPQETKRREYTRNGVTIREPYSRPIVPGLIFCLSASWPQWDVLSDRWGIRPLKVGDRPVAVTPLVLAHMAEVPQRIAAMRAAIEAREAAERLANLPVAGGSAVFTIGPFAGRVVQVQSVKGDEAALLLDGLRVTAKVSGLRRATT